MSPIARRASKRIDVLSATQDTFSTATSLALLPLLSATSRIAMPVQVLTCAVLAEQDTFSTLAYAYHDAVCPTVSIASIQTGASSASLDTRWKTTTAELSARCNTARSVRLQALVLSV